MTAPSTISQDPLASALAPAGGSVPGSAELEAVIPNAIPRALGAVAPSRRFLGPLGAALVTMRPRQWSKNALLVAAAGAAGALGRDDTSVRLALATVAFCLLASGIYALNDVRDVREDRLHPRKCHRPVAAGRVGLRTATALGIALILSGLAMCLLVRPLLGLVGAGYVLLTLSYTLVWRRFVIVDLVAIAGGFVLRAVAGGVAAPVPLSRWFVVVVTAAAILVAAGKRHAELQRASLSGGSKRRVLERYTQQALRYILLGSAAAAITAYCIWAFRVPTVHGFPWRPLTIAPFALCMARYGLLVRDGAGEAPEELILSDRWLVLGFAGWLLLFSLGVAAS